ncbi:PAS domain S-box protein [Leptolyngbya sp. FACHB-321]|uniref:PAS domain S-box protein n=1 Tax=Leptolyngbya sp. FACHB-321 TaxID=2692807 RepID=UPI001F558B6D|nr:PAS domain S-box protein [Leptolyngbya sp. FACHB-321]
MPHKPAMPLPANEPERLAALHRYKILDTPPEAVFDRLTRLAARLFNVPIALISLVDESRAWFKSGIGFGAHAVPRDNTLCSFAVSTDEPLIVPDARLDERFACNPFVQGEPGVRFYAGAPLLSHDGFNLGTLCLVDNQPHNPFTPEQQATLVDLAAMVVDELELRLAAQQVAQSETKYRTLFESLDEGFCLCEMLFDATGAPSDYRFLEVNAVFEALTGLEQATGKTVRALMPQLEAAWVELYGRVVRTGEAVRVVEHSTALNRWFDVNAFRVGEPHNHQFALLFTDITARKRTEQTLRESEERSQLAIGIAQLGTWRYVIATKLVELDQRMRAILGKKDSVVLPLSQMVERIHPDDRAKVTSALEAALTPTSSGAYDIDYRVIWDDGTERWLAANGQATFAGEGAWRQAVEVLGTAVDITDRKQVEIALQNSEEQFRQMADHAPFMVWVTDPSGYCTYLSQSWYDFTGQTPATGLGLGWLERAHADDRAAAQRMFLAANEQQQSFRLEYRLQSKQGDYIWAIDAASPWFGVDGAFKGYIGSVIDITDRKQAEAALAQRETELRLVTNAVPALIAFVDSDERYRFNNRGYEAWFGQPATEIYGKPVREVLGEAAYAGIRPYVEQVLAGQQVTFENQVPHQEGGTRYVSTTYVPRFDAQGAVVGFVALVNDISDRKRAEQALQASEAQIRNLLESITDAFFAVDEHWRFTYVNQTAELMVNRAADDLIGKVFWEEFPGVNDSAFEQMHRRVMRDRVAESLTAFYPNHERWYEVRAYPAVNGITMYFTDVTEQIQAAVALRQSEARYRTLFESIDEGFCVVEVLLDAHDTPIDYRVLEVNPVFEQQTGLQQAVGKTARQLNMEAHWIEIYGRVALTGEAIRFENDSETLKRWFDVYACRTGEPEDRKVAIVFKDISDRKRAEEMARQTAEANAFRVSLTDALRPLIDPIEMQAMASRLLGEDLGANRVAYFEVHNTDYVVERDYVKGAAGLAGRYPIASFGPKLLAAFRAGQTMSVSDVPADPDLSPEQRSAYAALEIGAHISVPLVKEGKLVAGLAIHTSEPRVWTPDEIALAEEVAERTWAAVERARAEAVVAADLQETQRLRALGARLITEDDTQTLYQEILAAAIALTRANAGTVQILDVATQELVLLANQGFEQTIITYFDRMSESANTPCGMALKTGNRSFVDFDVPESENHDRARRMLLEAGYRSGQSTPLITRAGKIIGMVSTHWHQHHRPSERELRFLDLLARQAADLIEQRQTAEEREQLLVREQAARAEADRANRIKDEFLAVLSHELRSPLNPILGWTQLLQNGKLDAARQAEALKTIERNAKLQAQLIEDLLDISRIMQGKLSLTAVPVSLVSVIAAALETVRLAADAKKIQITLDLTPNIAPIAGDAARLQQVVWNLLTNAVKFTPEGGQVTIALRQLEQAAQMQVIDTGRGIQPQFLPHVFEYFRQEDGSTTRKFGGLGLGLAIVRQIVAMHGGTVWAESEGEHQGAIFTVQLPLSTQAQPLELESPRHCVTTEAPLSHLQILLVDDETDTREFQTIVLEQSGAIVTAVTSGLEALQALEQFTPDLLVSDIGMAEMDGYMLIEQIRLRRQDAGGKMPALALTAYAGAFEQRKALESGFQAHLTKPVEPEDLVKAIVSLLRSQP